MVLRNVPSTATFEEQRVEINELAADVEALDAAALSNPDTLQTVTDRGFTTTNPIKIENNAATAFVVEDGSSNEKFVVDSVNGKINVGSSAGGASGIYLFHNNAGAITTIHAREDLLIRQQTKQVGCLVALMPMLLQMFLLYDLTVLPFAGKLQSKNSSDIAELFSGTNTGFRLLENGTNANVVMGWDGSATFNGNLLLVRLM